MIFKGGNTGSLEKDHINKRKNKTKKESLGLN